MTLDEIKARIEWLTTKHFTGPAGKVQSGMYRAAVTLALRFGHTPKAICAAFGLRPNSKFFTSKNCDVADRILENHESNRQWVPPERRKVARGPRQERSLVCVKEHLRLLGPLPAWLLAKASEHPFGPDAERLAQASLDKLLEKA